MNAASSAWSRRVRDWHFQFVPRYRAVWVALIALIVVCSFATPEIWRSSSLTFITALAGVLAIAAAGQLIVIISGGIDLSVPAVITLAGAIIVKQTNADDGQLAVAVGECFAAAAVVGLANGFLVAFAGINAFIVTLAMNSIVAGVTVLWATGSYSLSGEAPPALVSFTEHSVGPVSVLGVIGLAGLAILGFILRSSAVGRGFTAAGSNRVAAEIIGVRVRLYEVGGYMVAALLYVLAGILLVGIVQSPNLTLGGTYQLTTIVAVALGGASLAGGPGSMLSTAAGCAFVILLGQFLALENFESGVRVLANGVVLVVAVAMVAGGPAIRKYSIQARRLLSRSGTEG